MVTKKEAREKQELEDKGTRSTKEVHNKASETEGLHGIQLRNRSVNKCKLIVDLTQ